MIRGKLQVEVGMTGQSPMIKVSFDDPELSNRHFDLQVTMPFDAALVAAIAQSLDRAGNALPLSVSRVHDETTKTTTAILRASVRHWSSIVISTEPCVPSKLPILTDCDILPFDPDSDPHVLFDIAQEYIAARREGRLSPSGSCNLAIFMSHLGFAFDLLGDINFSEDCFFEAAMSSVRAHGIDSQAHAFALNNYAATLYNTFRGSCDSTLAMMRIAFNLLRLEASPPCECSSDDAREAIELNLAFLESQQVQITKPVVGSDVIGIESSQPLSSEKCFCDRVC